MTTDLTFITNEENNKLVDLLSLLKNPNILILWLDIFIQLKWQMGHLNSLNGLHLGKDCQGGPYD